MLFDTIIKVCELSIDLIEILKVKHFLGLYILLWSVSTFYEHWIIWSINWYLVRTIILIKLHSNIVEKLSLCQMIACGNVDLIEALQLSDDNIQAVTNIEWVKPFLNISISNLLFARLPILLLLRIIFSVACIPSGIPFLLQSILLTIFLVRDDEQRNTFWTWLHAATFAWMVDEGILSRPLHTMINNNRFAPNNFVLDEYEVVGPLREWYRIHRDTKSNEDVEIESLDWMFDESIVSMERVKYKVSLGQESGCFDCNICMQTFLRGQRCVLLQCPKRHLFHDDCVQQWFDTCRFKNRNTQCKCPVCMQPVRFVST